MSEINKNTKPYKDTLFLPKTDVAMKSNLTILEPKIIDFWNKINLYDLIQQDRKNAKVFNLHFGPPYANGDFHIGHAFNILLKDFILRSKNFLGFQTTSISGHDCHGQPIEYAVRNSGEKFESLKDFTDECKKFAEKWIEVQQKTLARLAPLISPDKFYRTLDMRKDIYEVFSEMLLSNLVYMEQKPVPWSIKEHTVIADSEIEYQNKISTSVDVALQIMDSPVESLKNKYVVIWTTTPWSLLDNVAVAFHQDMDYVFCEVDDKILIIGEKVLETAQLRLGVNLNPLGKLPGVIFAGAQCIHPILQQYVPMVHSDHVSDTDGTGFVHIAPAHGPEDFELCKKLNIPLVESISESGYYDSSYEKLAGKHIFRDEAIILDVLEGKLLAENKIEHSYPHTMRGATPIIYRASSQIFIDLKKAKSELKTILSKCKFKPEILKETLINTINNREEWCVSRQRVWGVPLCIFVHKKTKEILIDYELQSKVLENIENIDIATKFVDFLEDDEYEPYFGVLDVWFDSGCVSRMLSKYYDKKDSNWLTEGLYCEGKDQTRGWFQSSLLCAYLSEEIIPYNQIISHGFIVDESGYKMSKSKGNGVNLNDLLENRGSEILRILIALSDYTGDVKVGENLLNTAGETYRKIRNVLRYLISITENIETIEENIKFEFLDRAILNKLHIVKTNFSKELEEYNFKKAFDLIFSYIQYISGLYFNANKDCLYCDEEKNTKKQSTVKTMQIILQDLLIMFSIFLPFSTEDLYQYCKEKNILQKNKESIHLYSIKDLAEIKFEKEEELLESIEQKLMPINIEIDKLKKEGQIKRNSDLILYFNYDFDAANISTDVVKDLLNVAEVLKNTEDKLEISKKESCERCWKKSGNLCERCKKIV